MKYICVFLSGMICGAMIVMFITLTALDNRMDNLQPPLEGVAQQIEFLTADIKALRKPVGDYQAVAKNALTIMDACIQIGRAEVNDYSRMLVEMEDK